jgi:lysophospholipase L1-like esterase
MRRYVTAAVPLVLACALLSGCGDDAPAAESSSTAQPTGATTFDPPIGGGGAYIALGDSLSFGIGATSAEKAFVELIRQYLSTDAELINLGVPGHTSDDMLQTGKVDEAIAIIAERAVDANASNDVQLITLEIGGNDLLRIYYSQVQTGTCPDVEAALNRPECSQSLRDALDGFRPNFETALAQLREAAPDVPVVVMTLYNPFDFLGALGELGTLSLEGRSGTAFAEGMNDIIRGVVADHENVLIAEVYEAFDDRAGSLISSDFIHPNDAGYRAMADAVIAALER